MDQAYQVRGKAVIRKLVRQILRDVGFFQAFNRDFVTQIVKQQILFETL